MFVIVICLTYSDHLKFCVVCIDSRRYVCCSEYNVVSNQSLFCLVQLSARTVAKYVFLVGLL